MYSYLLFFHSLFRWFVLISLLYALYRAIKGLLKKQTFTKADNTVRHLTATMAHVQLAIGYFLYFKSPLIYYFRINFQKANQPFDYTFFGLIHVGLMTLAIIFITIGSSAAKRKVTDQGKFRTMAIWFVLALLLISIAIPWPFSPLANRPYLRFL